MKSMKITMNLPVFVIVILLAVVAGYEVFAGRAAAPGPAVVAVVRIGPLFDGLKQRAEAAAGVDQLLGEIETEVQARKESIEALREEHSNTVDAADRETLADEIALETLKNDFWLQTAKREHELDKAIRLQDLYKKVFDAIQTLAMTEGYDIVIVDDSGDELPFDRSSRVVPQVQVLQQLARRKVLFVNPTLDITEDLIMRMNNEFSAAQTGP
ncbi:MAG: OmpH family outer membrane protein [Planctomycetes bacterium]|nr:OmpH family outer membrane protein [Planctomycetota bacterium]